MTGYDEAREWLKENAPEWRLVHGRASLKAGYTIGAPTSEWVEVELEETSAGRHIGDGVFTVSEVTLTGEGASYVEAVQNAVGGLVSRDAADRLGEALG